LPRGTLPQADCVAILDAGSVEKRHTSGKLGKKWGAHFYLSKHC